LADIANEFRKAGSADEAAKRGYWSADNVHLGANGHELVKQTILGALASDK